jgi:hypothetical protein
MLISVTFGAFESVGGDLRDLAMHYGDVLEAGHGVDAPAAAAAVDGHRQHQDNHIKGFDHCSHAHGCAVVVASATFSTGRALPQRLTRAPSTLPPDAPSDGLYHPPRA